MLTKLKSHMIYGLLLILAASPSLLAVRTAIEMGEDDINLLKHIAARSYSDAVHDRDPDPDANVVIHRGEEDIDGIRWVKLPFRTAPEGLSAVGSVYYNAERRALVVAFHGSWWLQDWIDDAKINPRPARELSEGITGTVHTGFSSIVQSSYADMMRKVSLALDRPIDENDRVYFTGHSLGGALAILGGIVAVAENAFENQNVRIVTFSAPRGVIGNRDFVQRAYEILGQANILTISTKGDIVSHLTQQHVTPIAMGCAVFSSCTSFALSIPCVTRCGASLLDPGNAYVPIGVNVEVGPIEKAVSHYMRPIRDFSNLDEVAEHALRPLLTATAPRALWPLAVRLSSELPVLASLFKTVEPSLKLAVLAGEVFKTLHAIPEDGAVKDAIRYAQSNYRNGLELDELGEFSVFLSVRRNVVWRFLYYFVS